MTWQPGDHVVVRRAEWRVLRFTSFSDCAALDLAGLRSGTRRTLLVPFDRPRTGAAARLRVVSRRRWAHAVASLLTASFPFGGLQWCPPAIRLLPYQLEPALAMLRHGAVRVLIADDVGLGKTVEAGLIVREITKSSALSRTLIVCPSSLRDQWAQELRALLDLRAINADAAWLRGALAALPRDVNPWSLPGVYLASMDFVKRPEVLRPLEDLRWDLFVLDEAHAATPQSDRRAALDAIASRARRVVMLTATPHSGDEGQFDALCAIGSIGSSPPLVVFSRSRADTADAIAAGPPVRRTVLSVRTTAAERRMHRLLAAYTERLWRESARRKDSASALLATVLRKRALSSAGSLALSLRRRLQLLHPIPAASQLTLPLDDDVREDDAEGALAARGLENREDERAILVALADAADRASGTESKLRVLVRLIRRVREPVIVFSEYRDTAERLRAVLCGRGHRVVVLHGGLSPEERRAAISVFCGGGGALMVATDAASEGLNLHATCRMVVHFELPWTPSRLHQRCGRVNRIGQARRVHEIALVANDTAEQLVLEPLVRRAAKSGAFSQASIVGQLSEVRLAAHLLGGDALPSDSVPEPSFARMPLVAEARAEAERLEGVRRLAGRSPHRETPRADGIPIAFGRRIGPDRRITILMEITLSDPAGGVLAREIVALGGVIAGRWPRYAGELRAQAAVLLERHDAEFRSVAGAILTDRLSAVEPLHRSAVAAQRARGLDMTRRLRSAARDLVQAGLFDRRAMRAANERARTTERLDDDEQAHHTTGTVEGRIAVRAVLCGGPP